VEDGISGLADKIGSKEKAVKFLDKRLKSYGSDMQKLCNSISKPNL
jgi:hypothetical protein